MPNTPPPEPGPWPFPVADAQNTTVSIPPITPQQPQPRADEGEPSGTAVEALTAEEIAELRDFHRQLEEPWEPRSCGGCLSRWPCRTLRTIASYDAAVARADEAVKERDQAIEDYEGADAVAQFVATDRDDALENLALVGDAFDIERNARKWAETRASYWKERAQQAEYSRSTEATALFREMEAQRQRADAAEKARDYARASNHAALLVAERENSAAVDLQMALARSEAQRARLEAAARALLNVCGREGWDTVRAYQAARALEIALDQPLAAAPDTAAGRDLPTTASLTRADPDFTGGLSTEEHMARIRGTAAPEQADREGGA